MRKFIPILLFFFSISCLQAIGVVNFFPSIDHPTPVYTWYKQPNSGAFYSKVDEPSTDPTVDIEYVYSNIDTEPVIQNKKLKLLLKYSGNPIFSVARFPSKTLKIRCTQTYFDGGEELYVSYTPATVSNSEKLNAEYTDNTIVFNNVGCSTSGFATVDLDLGIDYALPPEANGAVIEFRWSGCNDSNGCIVKISSVEVVWNSFKVTPIISE